MPKYVVKASGEREVFDQAKIRRTLMRAGASPSRADEIVAGATKIVYDGMPTKELLKKVLSELRFEPHIASKYDLKGALLRLGPTGFTFEQVFARILQEHGYETITNPHLKGRCVTHEIDIVATKDKRRTFIECKYHNEKGIYTSLHVSMYTWARWVDLKEGVEKIDDGWLVTNTKFSQDAIDFGTCRGLTMIGWQYPKQGNLQNLIEAKDLWPVTVLRLDKFILEQLASQRVLLVKDILAMGPEQLGKKCKIPRPKADKLISDARALMV